MHPKLKSKKGTHKRAHIAILDCYSGISGDMTIGAFLDLGMDFSFLRRELLKLKLTGYTLSHKKIKREGQRGTQFSVVIKNTKKGKPHTVSYKKITALLDGSSLDKKVIALSKDIFGTLARAEAHVHGTRIEDVHFHEVGALDSIIDIVSAAICFGFFNIQKVFVKNIHLSSGHAHRTSHSVCSLPAPATLMLLEGYSVTFTDIPHELVTPTGASYIATVTKPHEPVPPFVVEKVGYGAGMNEYKGRTNFFRLIIGSYDQILEEETLVLLETNIDDMPPLVYEELFARLLSSGARDVFITPIIMKKNRPAHMVSVLFDMSCKQKIIDIIFSETSTIGVRFSSVRRAVLPRKVITVKTAWGPVKVKVSQLSDTNVKVYPEYESCKKLAQKHHIPFLNVYTEAQCVAQSSIRDI